MTKKTGLNLHEVPRNGETEFIFKVAERDGDSSFLTFDEIAEYTLAETIYEYRCHTPETDPHEARFYYNCHNEKDAYVRNVGFEAAWKQFDPKAYLGQTLANRSCAFTTQAWDIVEKYRSYKSRYFDERL